MNEEFCYLAIIAHRKKYLFDWFFENFLSLQLRCITLAIFNKFIVVEFLKKLREKLKVKPTYMLPSLFKCIQVIQVYCITWFHFFFVSTRFSVDFRRGCNRLFKQSCRKAITKKSWDFTLGIAYVSDVSFSYLKTLFITYCVFMTAVLCECEGRMWRFN